MNSPTRRHEARRRANRRSPVKAILGTAGAVAAAVALESSTVGSGSTGLTINGASAYDLAGLDVTRLAPGPSVAAPIRLANTGTTDLAIVPSAEVTAQAGGLGDLLLLALLAGSECPTPGSAPPGAPIATLGSGTDHYLLGVGGILDLCLTVSLSSTAPATVQGGSATFTLTFDAVQSRGAR